jgi:hypothetical protein
MRTAICCLLLAIAAPAMAFRARPVSDLRFEELALTDRAFPGPIAAASDGSDYLVLFRHETLPNIYTQVISQGLPYGPALLIGHGAGISVIWTGSEYLVAWWADDQSIFLTAVSRRGALLSEQRLVMSLGNGSRNAVSNGREILVTVERDQGVFGRLVSLNGDPLGNEFKIVEHRGGLQHAVTGTADGFALALFGQETRFFHLDDAAKPREASGTLVEGPVGSLNAYFSSWGVLASDGTNVAVIFSRWIGSSDPQVTTTYAMRSVIIDPRPDAIVQPRTLLSYQPYPAPEPNLGNVLWNGSEYVVVYSIAPALYSRERRVMLQRISRAGEPLDDPVLLSTAAEGSQWPSVIASNGRESMVTSGGSFVRLPIGSRNPTASTQLSRMVSSQSQLVMARRQDDFLAVWLESERDGKTIRASRIDAKGRYLDEAGIVIGTFPKLGTAGVYSWPTLSVDSDGKNWLVVWTYGDHVYGCRVSAAGVVLDPTPIAIPAAPVDFPLQFQGAVVRWGGTSWLVVSNTTRRMASTTVSSDGLVGPVKIIDDVSADIAPRNDSRDSFVAPLLDFDGQQFVVAIAVLQLDLNSGSDKWYSSIVTERLELSGDPIGGSKFISQPELYRIPSLTLATNGSQDLIVFRSGGEGGGHLQGLLFNRGFAPATIAIDQPSDQQPFDYDVAWNGNEFVVADIGAEVHEVHFRHLSSLGAVRDTITLPRDSSECCLGNVVFPRSSPVGQTTLGADPPLGLVTQNEGWSGVYRAQIAFAGDVADSQLQRQVPAAPVIGKAIGDPTGVTVTWQAQDGALGFDIELQQSDGTYRPIGNAAGGASSTHISYGGMTGTAVRLRAWNAAGLSVPSSEVPITTKRARAVGK